MGQGRSPCQGQGVKPLVGFGATPQTSPLRRSASPRERANSAAGAMRRAAVKPRGFSQGVPNRLQSANREHPGECPPVLAVYLSCDGKWVVLQRSVGAIAARLIAASRLFARSRGLALRRGLRWAGVSPLHPTRASPLTLFALRRGLRRAGVSPLHPTRASPLTLFALRRGGLCLPFSGYKSPCALPGYTYQCAVPPAWPAHPQSPAPCHTPR